MLANYGYQDGSGQFFITIDTDKCNGCSDCVESCPAAVLEMVEDEFDIDAESDIAAVAQEHANKLAYSCAPCKAASGYAQAELPCVKSCEPDAIAHSW